MPRLDNYSIRKQGMDTLLTEMNGHNHHRQVAEQNDSSYIEGNEQVSFTCNILIWRVSNNE